MNWTYGRGQNYDCRVYKWSSAWQSGADLPFNGYNAPGVNRLTTALDKKQKSGSKKVRKSASGREIEMPADTVIVSKADLFGRITYINQDFIDVSGYSKDELIGQPHNIVRHPDMPEAVFFDLWETIQGGRPWTGVVKNRASNGDHYWVKANVSPVRRGGQVVEYISVRVPASRDEIAAAEKVHAGLRSGRLDDGEGVLQRLTAPASVASRVSGINLHYLIIATLFLGILLIQS